MRCQTTIVAFNWMECALLGQMLWGNCGGEFVGIHGIRLLATHRHSASAILLCIWPGSVCAARDHRPEKLKAPTHETTHRHLIKHLTFHLWGASIEYSRTHIYNAELSWNFVPIALMLGCLRWLYLTTSIINILLWKLIKDEVKPHFCLRLEGVLFSRIA